MDEIWHKHKWSKWKEKDRYDMLRSSTKALVGFTLIQERVCEDCGKIQVNRQKVDY